MLLPARAAARCSLAGRVSTFVLVVASCLASASCKLMAARPDSEALGGGNSARKERKTRKAIAQCLRAEALSRKWGSNEDPAIENIPLLDKDGNVRALYVVSDVHGHFEEFFTLLETAGVIARVPGNGKLKPSSFRWAAGNAVLVHAGDLINKGKRNVETLKFAQNLEIAAAAGDAKGQVVFVAGNHEIRFLGNPFDEKFDDFARELGETKLYRLCGDPAGSETAEEVGAVGEGEEADLAEPPTKIPLAVWLGRMPGAAMMGGVYMSHSGWTRPLDKQDLATSYKEAFVAQAAHTPGDGDDAFLCGTGEDAGRTGNASDLGFVNANAWWDVSSGMIETALARVGAKQILFGHDPNAFANDGFRGDLVGFFAASPGVPRLVNLDAGIFQENARGAILRCPAGKWSAEGACTAFEKLVIPWKTKRKAAPVFEPLGVHTRAPRPRQRGPRDGC